MGERLLSRSDLYRLLGMGMKPGSFKNWLSRRHAEGFPRPIEISSRTVRWREGEIMEWLESRQRSSAAKSPRKKPARMTVEQRTTKALKVLCARCYREPKKR